MAGPHSDAADRNAERVICDRGERRSADRASSELHRQQTRDAGVGSGRVDRVHHSGRNVRTWVSMRGPTPKFRRPKGELQSGGLRAMGALPQAALTART